MQLIWVWCQIRSTPLGLVEVVTRRPTDQVLAFFIELWLTLGNRFVSYKTKNVDWVILFRWRWRFSCLHVWYHQVRSCRECVKPGINHLGWPVVDENIWVTIPVQIDIQRTMNSKAIHTYETISSRQRFSDAFTNVCRIDGYSCKRQLVHAEGRTRFPRCKASLGFWLPAWR